jgi:hypothetical protein
MNASVNVKAVRTTTRRSGSAIATGLLLIVALWATLIAAQPAGAKGGDAKTIKRAALSGSASFAGVNGEAKWTSKGSERELEVQIEDAKALKGKRLTVRIGSTTVGHMTVSALGRARLVRATEAGQNVPQSVAGKTVKIRTAGGKLVASGRF